MHAYGTCPHFRHYSAACCADMKRTQHGTNHLEQRQLFPSLIPIRRVLTLEQLCGARNNIRILRSWKINRTEVGMVFMFVIIIIMMKNYKHDKNEKVKLSKETN
jgi:hypothetical protein